MVVKKVAAKDSDLYKKSEKRKTPTPLSRYVTRILTICATSGYKLSKEYPGMDFNPSSLYDSAVGRTTPTDETIEEIAPVLHKKLKDCQALGLIADQDWSPEYASLAKLKAKLRSLRDGQPRNALPAPTGAQVAQVFSNNFGRLDVREKRVAAGLILLTIGKSLGSAKMGPISTDQFNDQEEDFGPDLVRMIEEIEVAMVAAAVESIGDYANHLIDAALLGRRTPEATNLRLGLAKIIDGELPSEDSEEFAITMRLLSEDLCDRRFKGDPAAMISALLYEEEPGVS